MNEQPLRAVLRFFHELCSRDSLQADDHALLRALIDTRDEHAFAVLVHRHGPMVLSVCRRVLHKNEADAEDAFQATFLVLVRKAGSVRRGQSLHSWLYKVAFRVAQRLRIQIARRKTSEIPAEITDPKVVPDALLWSEVRSTLDEELQELPEKYRAPLVLCCLSGKTRDEAAEELGWSLNVLKGRLERGRKLLQARLLLRGVEFSAALLTVTIAQTTSAAAIPAPLVSATLTTAAASNCVVATVFQLAEAEIQAMAAIPLKLTSVILLVLSCTVLGAAAIGLAETPTKISAPNSMPRAKGGSKPGFQNIASQSGLTTILAERHTATPNWRFSGLHLVDLDGDGHLDLFVSVPGAFKSGSVAALNNGKGQFKLAPGSCPPTELILAHDLDEDGKVDLNFASQDGSQWWLNKSKPGELKFEVSQIRREADSVQRQALIDVNRDGKVDWIRTAPDAIMFDLAHSKGSFIVAGQLPLGSRAESSCLPIDIDGDGDFDLLVQCDSQDGTSMSRVYRNDNKPFLELRPPAANVWKTIQRNDANKSFTDVTEESGLKRKNLAIKAAADVNQDGSPDLIVFDDMKPAIYLNNSKGKFSKLADAFVGMDTANSAHAASRGLAVMTDFDNDGIPDLLWNGKGFLWILRGIGGGRFEYMNAKWGIEDFSDSATDDGHCFGDFNDDGLLDIVGTTSNEQPPNFAIYQSSLPRDNNWLRVKLIGAPGNRSATGAKIRISDQQTNKLLWFEQITTYSNQSAQNYYTRGITERHYGLGQLQTVNVEVEFYPSGKRVKNSDVSANGNVTVSE